MNGTAPKPVRNAEFAKTFSSVLRKPYTPVAVLLPVGPPGRACSGSCSAKWPASSRPVRGSCRPRRSALGYPFKYPHLADALRAIFTPARPEPRASRPRIITAAAGAGSHH